MKRLLCTLFLGLTAILPAESAEPSDETMAAITKLREDLVDCFNKGDIDRLLSNLDPDVIVTWQNGEVCHGPDAVRAYYNRMMTGDKRVVRSIDSKPEVLGRQVHGDWAVSWGNLHEHFVLMDGSDLPFNSVFTATTVRHGDRWFVTAFHASVNAFDNPVLGLAVHKIALWCGAGGSLAGFAVGLVLGRFVFRRKSA
jgi:ketosteroid isomerase-like protein